MKKSILTSGLVLSLLVGGAGLSSMTVGAAPINEKPLNVELALKEEAQPMAWAALG
ncbi:hypothetical protein P9B03_02565 [Metasolibacillus meyeri]|uniref:Uncharacterized protein n=1 Tax=Metasolibacillus meyeri TaxID=1071052 RepID=A0AAW9NSG4_9BACL|nr:hypothetical protein [Metasolibacillus meyeri]MEC1177355.1 hypothetical protein [Metasolibacillus meyeri]